MLEIKDTNGSRAGVSDVPGRAIGPGAWAVLVARGRVSLMVVSAVWDGLAA